MSVGRNDGRAERGFSLIELVLVVVVIGVLAAIAIPAYLLVQSGSKDSTVRSDVVNLKAATVAVQTGPGSSAITETTTWSRSGTALPAALLRAGASEGSNTASLTYYPAAASGFCVLGVGTSGNSFAVTDQSGVAAGSCTPAGRFSSVQVTKAP